MVLKMRRVASVFLVTTCLLGSTAFASSEVYVRIRPPAPIVEVRHAPPHHGYVWREGYHHWDGHRYVWIRGRWVRPPYAHAVWTSGRWAPAHRGWHWVPGHWVR